MDRMVTRWIVQRVSVVRIDWPLMLLDTAVTSLTYLAVMFLRFEGRIPAAHGRTLLLLLPLIILIHLGANASAGLYGCVWDQAGVEEARRLLIGGVAAGLVVVGFVLVAGRPLPLSTAVFGSAGTLLIVGGTRFQSRVFGYRRRHRKDPQTAVGVVVVGSGRAGGTLVREMLAQDGQDLRPVAVVDEDPRQHGRSLCGVPVLGGLEALREAAVLYDARLAVLARPDATGQDVQRVKAAADAAGLPVKTLPSLAEMAGGAVGVRDVRDLEIQDLLGRTQVASDMEDDVRRVFEGRCVLITGAGGSIGSEIARQVAVFGPARLVLLDHDETHLHDAAAKILGESVQVLADIRDELRISTVMARERPDVVFHAAAHKHVPVLEAHPCEAISTNVVGTDNVLRACLAADVQRLVFISTDKAVRPRSVMGATKRIGEQLLLARRPPGRPWAAVRFGNVLGSRGSVVPTFMRQIGEGGPVTVTHPDMTRFFMSIPEAVQLVLRATAMSEGGELFMLDMGDPVRVADLADRMIEMSGRKGQIDIVYSGLRPGEKLAESLHEPEETSRPTQHPAVLALRPVRVPVGVLDDVVGRLARLAREQRPAQVVELLFEHLHGPVRDLARASRVLVVPELDATDQAMA